ncbi:hypothetical protein D918_03031, partial [Trichuris suis]
MCCGGVTANNGRSCSCLAEYGKLHTKKHTTTVTLRNPTSWLSIKVR